MFRFISLIFFLLFSSLCYAESNDSTELSKSVKWKYKVDSIANSYSKEMDALVAQRSNTLRGLSYERPLNAYGLRMVLPPTFYSSSVLQQFSVNERRMYPDDNLMYMYMINDVPYQPCNNVNTIKKDAAMRNADKKLTNVFISFFSLYNSKTAPI